MERRKRRSFTTELKIEAVRLVREGTKSLPQVAQDLDLTESALRLWVQKADEAEAKTAPGALNPARCEVQRIDLRHHAGPLQLGVMTVTP